MIKIFNSDEKMRNPSKLLYLISRHESLNSLLYKFINIYIYIYTYIVYNMR